MIPQTGKCQRGKACILSTHKEEFQRKNWNRRMKALPELSYVLLQPFRSRKNTRIVRVLRHLKTAAFRELVLVAVSLQDFPPSFAPSLLVLQGVSTPCSTVQAPGSSSAPGRGAKWVPKQGCRDWK